MEHIKIHTNTPPEITDFSPPTSKRAANEISANDLDQSSASGSQSKRIRSTPNDNLALRGSVDDPHNEENYELSGPEEGEDFDQESGEVSVASPVPPAHGGRNPGVGDGLRSSLGVKEQTQGEPGKSDVNFRPTPAVQDSPREEVETGRAASPGPMPARPVLIPQPSPATLNFTPHEMEAYLKRYFPGVDPEAAFCILCVSYGHFAISCPDLALDIEYPPVRAFPTVPKGMVCGRCHAPYHAEIALWRTYEPIQGRIRKVKSLIPSCFRCGSKEHYGMDCEQASEQSLCVPRDSFWQTWSRWNFRQYVDAEAVVEPLSSTLPPGSVLGALASTDRPNLGKSIIPQRHVVFEAADDDEDNEPLVRAPVQRKPGPKQINISIAGRTATGGGRNGNIFPPLPPGPPPPLPSEGAESSKQKSKAKARRFKGKKAAKNQQQPAAKGDAR